MDIYKKYNKFIKIQMTFSKDKLTFVCSETTY